MLARLVSTLRPGPDYASYEQTFALLQGRIAALERRIAGRDRWLAQVGAAVRVWALGAWIGTVALAAWALMTGLGNLWNHTFFGKRQLRKSVKVMAAFWASLAGSIAAAHAADPAAGKLIAPTLVWVTIAAKLNHAIVSLNKDKWEDKRE